MDSHTVKSFLRGDYTEAEGTNLPDMIDILCQKTFFLHDIIVLGL